VRRFRYLNQTVAVVLGVVAVKLLIQDLYKVPAPLSLALVLGLFAAGIWLSVRADRREDDTGDGDTPPPVAQPSSAS
jgi:tellurite resistance protein TerC